MSTQPLLSIITATYKDAAGLAQTIDSLKPLLEGGLGRDQAWEHIIVDSSPEESRPAKEKLPLTWPLVYLPEKAAGIYAAHNSGLARARGQYLWFLNGGDRLRNAEDLLKVLQSLERAPDAALAIASADLMRDSKFMYTQSPKDSWQANLIGMNRVCHQAVIYRRSHLLELGSFSTDLKIAADYEHLYRCFASGAAALFQPDQRIVEYDMTGVSQKYGPAFSEFRKVQKLHAGELPLWMRVANPLIWGSELGRVALVKSVAASPLADTLRPLWLKWRRRGE